MSGIAEVLLNLGYAVQGSDLKPNAVTRAPASARRAHHASATRAENVDGADVVVVSSAVDARQPGGRARRWRGAFRSCRAPRCSAS